MLLADFDKQVHLGTVVLMQKIGPPDDCQSGLPKISHVGEFRVHVSAFGFGFHHGV